MYKKAQNLCRHHAKPFNVGGPVAAAAFRRRIITSLHVFTIDSRHVQQILDKVYTRCTPSGMTRSTFSLSGCTLDNRESIAGPEHFLLSEHGYSKWGEL